MDINVGSIMPIVLNRNPSIPPLNTPVEGGVGFENLFRDALDRMSELSGVSRIERTRVVLGEEIDLHTAIIEGQKSGLAQDLFIQVRNRGVEAYNEIMRTPL